MRRDVQRRDRGWAGTLHVDPLAEPLGRFPSSAPHHEDGWRTGRALSRRSAQVGVVDEESARRQRPCESKEVRRRRSPLPLRPAGRPESASSVKRTTVDSFRAGLRGAGGGSTEPGDHPVRAPTGVRVDALGLVGAGRRRARSTQGAAARQLVATRGALADPWSRGRANPAVGRHGEPARVVTGSAPRDEPCADSRLPAVDSGRPVRGAAWSSAPVTSARPPWATTAPWAAGFYGPEGGNRCRHERTGTGRDRRP